MATRLERIAMVGAGLTGTYLALDWARAGHPVTIYDVDHERARTAPERTREIGAELVRGGVTDQTALDEALTRLASTPDLQAAVGQADYVAEAIVKDLPTKQALFGELDALCSERTVLASNTSSLLPSALAQRTSHPERLLVVHCFFPAHLLPAVEVVPGARPPSRSPR